MSDKFLYWRYTFTLEYKTRKYSRHYNNLKKRYTWDLSYWRNIKYIIERIVEILFGIVFVYSGMIIMYMIDDGFNEFGAMGLFAFLPIIFCITVIVFWSITGDKAISMYGPKAISSTCVKSKHTHINVPEIKEFNKEEREEYIKFWETYENDSSESNKSL